LSIVSTHLEAQLNGYSLPSHKIINNPNTIIIHMLSYQWLLTKPLKFSSSARSLTCLCNVLFFLKIKCNGKNKIYPSESQSPSTIGHSSLQSKFANKLHTHTKQEWILSFQNQCLLIVEPLPCSTACIVFLNSTKKQQTLY
jgi:hypothetical protein